VPDWYWQRPPVPPPPPRSRWSASLFGHWRRPVSTWTTHDWTYTVVAITALVVLLVSSAGGVAAVIRDNLSSAATPITTASRGPHIITGPYLGGSQDAFTAAFGQPADSYGQLYYPFTTPDGFSAQVCFCSARRGSDGRERLAILSINVPDLDPSQHPNVVRLFFPPDAHHVADLTDPEIGPFHVYQSASLAQTFPATAFTNSSGGGLVPPGTFGMACEPPSPACTIAIGE
jgi:hypothetical protein